MTSKGKSPPIRQPNNKKGPVKQDLWQLAKSKLQL
ncbi:hypothetical protein ABIE50_006346 [Chitinophaga sp. OAE865]